MERHLIFGSNTVFVASLFRPKYWWKEEKMGGGGPMGRRQEGETLSARDFGLLHRYVRLQMPLCDENESDRRAPGSLQI